MIAIYVIIGIIVILLIAFIVIYNRLVNVHNQMKNTWAQVDVQLKRRHDLIPNLVETVKGYMQHERQTLESVTNARNLAQAASGASVGDRAKAEGELSGALARLLVVVENYPDLKANQNFLRLQQELTTTENNISSVRQSYNDMVLMCNNLYQMFPSNIVARIFGYRTEEFFEVKLAEERAVPKVGLA
ncbi:MAG: LemA family protein [Chloroflexota bacterium]|nr:LemA family protein [Chloroflexota bacterium]